MFDELIDDILREWVWRLANPTKPDINNPEHLYHLQEAMAELKLPNEFISEYISNLQRNEADKEEKEKPVEKEEPKKPVPPRPPEKEDSKDDKEDDESKPETTDAEKMKDDASDEDIISFGGKTYRLDMLSDLEIEDLKKKKKEEEKESNEQ